MMLSVSRAERVHRDRRHAILANLSQKLELCQHVIRSKCSLVSPLSPFCFIWVRPAPTRRPAFQPPSLTRPGNALAYYLRNVANCHPDSVCLFGSVHVSCRQIVRGCLFVVELCRSDHPYPSDCTDQSVLHHHSGHFYFVLLSLRRHLN